MVQDEIHTIRGIVFAIVAARRATSWPWRATCGECGRVSPHQRTNDDARRWADSHTHTDHELDRDEELI